MLLGSFGFLLLQASRAADIRQSTPQWTYPVGDTSARDSLTIVPTPDAKQEFQNLFTTAMTGDGVHQARLNPMAVSFVKSYIARNSKGFQAMKEWAKGYFTMMDQVLTEHGIPKELKYLAVIESGLKYNAKSWSGAVGPWAFMPDAARTYGLKIARGRDERLDYFKSTHAAARLLTDLYSRYGDWLLVVAAYNSGPANVDKAIRKSNGSRDFWTLQYFLPNETMNHVKKFIGCHYIFEGAGGITTLTKAETREMLLNSPAQLAASELEQSTAYTITGRFFAPVIMKYVDIDTADFYRYNPGFDNEIAVNGKYELRLPTEKMNIFVAHRYEILDESLQQLLKAANGAK